MFMPLQKFVNKDEVPRGCKMLIPRVRFSALPSLLIPFMIFSNIDDVRKAVVRRLKMNHALEHFASLLGSPLE